jgi:hypothetical protein
MYNFKNESTLKPVYSILLKYLFFSVLIMLLLAELTKICLKRDQR